MKAETKESRTYLRFDCSTTITVAFYIILFLLFSGMYNANCQSPHGFDNILFSGYFNPYLGENGPKTKVYISRLNEKLIAAQELTSCLAGGKFHVPMKRSEHAHSSVLFHYSDELRNFSKGLRNQAVEGGYAHYLELNSKSQLSAAMHLSWHMQHFSMNGFTTGSQYVKNEGFDPNMHVNEPFEDYRSSWISAGIGLRYFRRMKMNHYLVVGLTGHNLNRPGQVQGKDGYRLKRIYLLQAMYQLPVLEERLSFMPMLGFNNHYNGTISVGTNAVLRLPQTLNGFNGFSVKAMHNVNQSTTLGFKVHHPKITLGINQTIYNREVPVLGATEFLLVYFFGSKDKPAKSMKEEYHPITRSFYTFDTKKVLQVSEPVNNIPSANFQLSRYVEFTFNSDSVTREARAYLDELVTLLESDPDLKIEIMGHTDNVGTEEDNRKLSLQRARAVADYLADKNISVGRINIVGFGASEPLNDNSSVQKRAHNRRVDIRIYKESAIE